MNWGNLAKFLVATIPSVVLHVKNEGHDPKTAGIDISKDILGGIKTASGKDVINDPKVLDALTKVHHTLTDLGDAVTAVENS